MSSLALLERGAALSESGIFLQADDLHITYREAVPLVRKIANALVASGFSRGQNAAVLSANDPHAFLASLGVHASGMAIVPLNPGSPAAEIARVLRQFECTVLFYQADLDAIVSGIRADLPLVRRFIRLGHGPHEDTSLADLIAGASAEPPGLVTTGDDIGYIAQTGGTTGEPKGVMVSWRAVNAFVTKFLSALHDPSPVLLAATPLTHAAGMLTLPIMASGGRVIVMKRPDPLRFLGLIERERVTVTFLPPTVIYRLLDLPELSRRDFSSLRHFIYGAAPMSLVRLKQALAVFGPVMTQFYGQTECHSLIAVMTPADHFVGGAIAPDARLSACGRASIGTTIVIQDDQGQLVPQGQRGEVCVNSDLAMSGYFRNPEATADVLCDGFIHTGDVGLIDDDGFLHIVDRKKDMIISGGFNVYPAEVENVLRAHPAISECAVFGVSHPDWGEEVVAAVEFKTGPAPTMSVLKDFARERLGGVKTPKSIFALPSLPRSAVGKVLKREVKAIWEQQGARTDQH